ncbi:MAG: Hsp20/alpha crystallin family protein [Methanobacterium sp.]|jgi:HSP20 family protein
MSNRNIVEQMINNVVDTIRESQGELERTISGYTSGGSNNLLVDIVDGVNDVTVIVDLPGVKKDNVTINVGEDALDVVALFIDEIIPTDVDYVKRERKQGEVRRVVNLPAKIRIDDATAAFENGVLMVLLPKIEQKNTSTVNIN